MQKQGIASAKAQGKEMGRPKAADASEVVVWRTEHGASIKETAEHFQIGLATVKRYCATERSE
jgi:putative DNA-invertase from lambdoid prophage Rac